MEYRNFGNTGLHVSAIGFGAGHIGTPGQSETDIALLLHELMERGINLIDTARSYGTSEERIGRILGDKRKDVILSTKVGYGFKDKPDWSYESTMGTIDESLQLLRTDYLDIVHLHSCDQSVLAQGEAIRALEDATVLGKVRFPAYSGENEALQYAINTNRFRSIQCSVNPFDQHGLQQFLPAAAVKGLGIIAKRPLGNCVWRYSIRPDQHGHVLYYDRYQEMGFIPKDLSWNELAVRYSAFSPYVNTIILGSSNLKHILENLTWFEKGSLPDHVVKSLNDAYNVMGVNLPGLI